MSAAAGLEGRVIAVTGACGGLGPAVCRSLGEAGASLALVDVDEGKLAALAGELGLGEERIATDVVDLLDGEATAEWAARTAERFGRVDGLAHLVGGWRGGEPLAEAPLSDYEWLHDLLVRTLQHTTRALHDEIAASEHGRVVIVSSAAAQSPEGTNAAYAAAKAASEAWTLALADSFAGAEGSATANIVVVNAILTPAMRAENPDKDYPSFTSDTEIAEAIAYLCSDAAAKMNGKRLALYP